MKTASRLAALLGLAALSACGNVTSRAQPVFATSGTKVGPGSEFPTQAVKRFVLVNGTRSLKDQTIRVSFSADGQTAYVEQNHKKYTLPLVAPGEFYAGNADLIDEITLSDDVHTMFFQDSVGSGYYNGGHLVVGYKTNPAQMSPATRGGSATYNGQTRLSVRTMTGNGFSRGSTTLTANFATGVLNGTMSTTDDAAAGGTIAIPDATITVNPGGTQNISGNRFSTDLGIAFVPVPGSAVTIGQAGLSGNFYGVNAASAGGTYWAEGTLNGGLMLIEGAFAAN